MVHQRKFWKLNELNVHQIKSKYLWTMSGLILNMGTWRFHTWLQPPESKTQLIPLFWFVYSWNTFFWCHRLHHCFLSHFQANFLATFYFIFFFYNFILVRTLMHSLIVCLHISPTIPDSNFFSLIWSRLYSSDYLFLNTIKMILMFDIC